MKYSVNLWGSNPFDNNDDCWTGLEFESKDEALFAYENPMESFGTQFDSSTAFIELEGPDLYLLRENEDYKETIDTDASWRLEQAMEAGMLHGIDAYNDMMEG